MQETQEKIRIQTNVVFDHLCESEKRFIVEQGGTRSGKTYNILIWMIFNYSMQNTDKVISVVRKTQPSLQGTVFRDFQNILMDAGIYDERLHNKTRNEYRLNGNLWEFIAVDDPQKIRGRRRDLAFLNEANELTYEDFKQINFRTNDRIIIDYNPSDVFHWIYDELIPRKDQNTGEPETDFFQTTFRDNPFLPKSLIREIEALQYTDPDAWGVYGLGEKAILKDIVFSQWRRCTDIPKDAKFMGYGLDFGYTADPTALVGVYEMNKELYVEEIIYENGLTNQDIVKKMTEINVSRSHMIYADSAEPKSIEEIRRGGFKIMPCPKGRDSISHGIDRIKSRKLHILDKSKNLLKEIQMYKWIIDKDGNNTGVPIDRWNHALDALRYWALTNIKRANYGKYMIK